MACIVKAGRAAPCALRNDAAQHPALLNLTGPRRVEESRLIASAGLVCSSSHRKAVQAIFATHSLSIWAAALLASAARRSAAVAHIRACEEGRTNFSGTVRAARAAVPANAAQLLQTAVPPA
jgi:hypothetical protein